METALQLLTHYGYLILFPLSIIEGPIVTVLAGFLVTMRIMNPFAIFGIVVFGDVLGDSVAYWMGRYGGKGLARAQRLFRVTPEKLEQAKGFFQEHHHKTLILSKVFHGVGVAGLLAAGILKVSYRRYFFTCLSVSLVQSFILLMVGIFFGHFYAAINNYLNVYAASISVIVVVALGIFILYKTKSMPLLGK